MSFVNIAIIVIVHGELFMETPSVFIDVLIENVEGFIVCDALKPRYPIKTLSNRPAAGLQGNKRIILLVARVTSSG